MIKTNLLIVIVVCFFVCGCTEQKGPRLLIVKYPVKVYKTGLAGAKDHIFTLLPGDVCALGDKKESKPFTFTEVLCYQKGYGWILGDDALTIIDKSKYSSAN